LPDQAGRTDLAVRQDRSDLSLLRVRVVRQVPQDRGPYCAVRAGRARYWLDRAHPVDLAVRGHRTYPAAHSYHSSRWCRRHRPRRADRPRRRAPAVLALPVDPADQAGRASRWQPLLSPMMGWGWMGP